MPNPPLLLCDSDALIQFFIVDDLRPLKELQRRFAIQPTITLEVELELRWAGRHKNRFVSQLEKSLKSTTLVTLDKSRFQTFLGNAVPGTSWGTFQTLGMQYTGIVQRGEAYTHAAAVTLGFPVLSNDQRAVLTLLGQMLRVGVPVLRSFDVFKFACDCGVLEIRDCEEIRSKLIANGEGVPGSFRNASFEVGAKSFPCRLVQTSTPEEQSPTPQNYYDPLTLAAL